MAITYRRTIFMLLIGWKALCVVAGSSTSFSQQDIQIDHIPVQFVTTTTTERTLQEPDLKGPDLLSDGPNLNIVKRAPMGFQGMRGKKDHADEQSSVDNSYLLQDDVPRGMMSNNHLQLPINKWAALSNPAFLNAIEKPSEFNGIDANKDQSELSTSQNEENDRLQNQRRLLDDFEHRYINSGASFKRVPSMGFHGMRGKKDDDESTSTHNTGLLSNNHLQIPLNKWAALSDPTLYPNENDKRAPSGFLGMRGKKDTLLDEMQFLMSRREEGERLENERRLLSEFARQYQQFEQTPIDNGGGAPSKRAPSTGFFGMRGKKFDVGEHQTSELMLGEAAEKRAGGGQHFGFVGMRGKKWSDEDGFDVEEGMAKRAPSLGFHGMRGKKDVNDVMQFEKRAPSTGFFGMRGKKAPMGFFGTRGKKGPFELRHKFVGVRGKKVPGGVPLQSGVRQLRTGNEYLMPEMQSAHLSVADMVANKRAPTGFLGMRGKKWSDSTLD